MFKEAMAPVELDIIVPVYEEANNITPFLLTLKNAVKKTRIRVLICYDSEEDATLSAIKKNNLLFDGLSISYVRNNGSGPHSAILSGFKAAQANAILVMPADDHQNASIIDRMYEEQQQGADVVCASRLMPGGSMRKCPLLKSILVRCAGFSLYYFAGLPTRDATNGFRMFSKNLLNLVTIQSKVGFTYSIELLVKCHRLNKKVAEIPANWIERDKGKSRFKLFKWLLPYLRWYFYAFSTRYLRRQYAFVSRQDS